MSFGGKNWRRLLPLAMGVLGFVALWSGSLPLIALAGGVVVLGSVSVALDWRGAATALRREKAQLGVSAVEYRIIGIGGALIGLALLTLALIRLT